MCLANANCIKNRGKATVTAFRVAQITDEVSGKTGGDDDPSQSRPPHPVDRRNEFFFFRIFQATRVDTEETSEKDEGDDENGQEAEER